MKKYVLILIVIAGILFQQCEEDAQELPCIEGTILGPVCPFGAGYLGYNIFINDSIPGAIRHYDDTSGEGFVVAALNLPESYRNQTGLKIFFTAREATPEEIGLPDPQTANCVQPPLITIERVKSSCTSGSGE